MAEKYLLSLLKIQPRKDNFEKMPLYVYRCQKCDNEEEVLQKLSDDPLTDCEKCSSMSTMEKVMGKTSFILKGDCWYKDGYTKGKKS